MKKILGLCIVFCMVFCSVINVDAKEKTKEKIFTTDELAEFDINDLDENLNLADAINEYPIIKEIYYIGLTDEEAEEMSIDISQKDENTVRVASNIKAKEFLSYLNAMRPKAVEAKMIKENNDKVAETEVEAVTSSISANASYGVAWPYITNTSTTTNCYGYALGWNAFKNPGDIYYHDGATYTTSSTVTDVANNMIRDANRAQLTPRTISSATASINSNEYRIVTRVGYHYISGIGWVWDYHWMRQNSTGGWCHKPGQTPSADLGNINPSTYSWNLGTYYNNFYDSTPVYIATPKLPVCIY